MRSEGVQGVLNLFCSEAAQVWRDLRVEKLKEQLEKEEEDGDRQEWNEDDCECAQNLSHRVCGAIIK